MHRNRLRPHRRSPRPLGFATTTVLLLSVPACSDSTPAGPGPGTGGSPAVDLQPVVSGLSSPIFLTAPPGDPRLFIVEQAGRIRIFEGGTLEPVPFLDIANEVRSGGERGLFSVAFHPDFPADDRFFVDYTDNSGDTRVEEYRLSGDPDVADPASARLILAQDQPFSNHNGGQLEFGPDGMLYVAFGDGGSGGDPQGHGQDLSTWLGAMLRIDVDGGLPYEVPPDNPFVGTAGALPEIWAYGLRNPWRFSFDGPGSRLYIADVGQSAREEVNAVSASAAGLNYGWNLMEGSQCFGGGGCSTAGLTLPVLEYGHGEGCSVTGGIVYRGSAIPELAGHYVYADFCAGWIRNFRLSGGAPADQAEWEVDSPGSIVSFGRDGSGELYVVSGGGSVWRVVARG